jgi:hypothetical protein
MIATGSFFHIQLSTYHPAPSPLSHAWMVPVGTINLFVGLASVSDPTEVRPCSHTNTSPCTSGVERDTQDTSPDEARRKRDTQDNSAGSFENPKPHTPGRDPVWTHGGDGLP